MHDDMNNVRYKEYPPTALRYHYWNEAEHDPRGRYYDFRGRPELIPEVLEDFLPFGERPAVQRFYRFLASVNGDDSFLETDDCAFRGPQEKPAGAARRLYCTGRVILLFRTIQANLDRHSVETLAARIGYHLQASTPDLPDGAAQVAIAPTSYSPYAGLGDEPIGGSVEITFWADGDDEDEVFDTLDAVVTAMAEAIAKVNAELEQAVKSG
jgi:hypothetical protein